MTATAGTEASQVTMTNDCDTARKDTQQYKELMIKCCTRSSQKHRRAASRSGCPIEKQNVTGEESRLAGRVKI
jgi:hypothetical protein